MHRSRKKRCFILKNENKQNQFNACRLEDFDSVFSETKFNHGPLFKIILAKNIYTKIGVLNTGFEQTLVIFAHEEALTDLCDALKSGGVGYLCVFEESFLSEKIRTNIRNLPMFVSTTKAEYKINEEQYMELSSIFRRMMHELSSSYHFKYDLIKIYITQIIHFGVRLGQTAKRQTLD